jgi:hypothetical protein
VLPLTDDLGSLIARESSEARDGKLSPRKTGDLPEMSCVPLRQLVRLQASLAASQMIDGMIRRIRGILRRVRSPTSYFGGWKRWSMLVFGAKSFSSQ